MKAQFGFIGKEEIEKAKEELVSSYKDVDGSWMDKNLWFEKTHTGNYIKGYAYDDIEELLEETESSLDVFKTKADIDDYCLEFDYLFSDEDLGKLKSIIERGSNAYMLDEQIDDSKEDLIFNKIEDGQYMWKGNAQQAYEQLNDWNGWDNDFYHTELLVIGLLK